MRNQFPRGEIHFNGKSSADLGIIVSKYPIMRKPARKGTVRTIPGRSGAIVSDTRAYETYVQPYEISIINKQQGIAVAARAVADWLLGSSGYCRLEDDFEPDIYRMARYASQLDIETIMTMHGTAVIEFECQPQRYLKSGEQEIELTEELTTLRNPTAFAASPLIKVEMQSEAETITPVDVPIELTVGKYIGNKKMAADSVHRVITVGYTDCSVSQAIDVSGYESAVITTTCYERKPASAYEHYGLGMATCYTLYNSAGNPLSKIVDYQKMEGVTIPIPKSAKWLYICVANKDGSPLVEPSVTLIPALATAGTGSVTINGKQATIEFADRSVIYLDCEAHNAFFEDGSNANAAVTFTEQGNSYPTFPTLDPGENQISMSATEGTEVKASIKPRWWTL